MRALAGGPIVKFEIQAEARAEQGRAQSRKLRRLGRVPAIIYGGGKEPSTITLDGNKLNQQMELESFYTSILNLKIGSGSEAQPVVVKEVQRHPARSTVMHLDFQRIVADQEITMTIPLHFVGEADAPGVKEQGGVVEHSMTEVEITCLPANLPAFIEVSVAHLALNEILHLSEIKYPEGVRSTQLAHGHDLPVAAVHPPRREEVEAVVAPVEGAEAAAAATPEGGEAAAAGAAAPGGDAAKPAAAKPAGKPGKDKD
jgi:large subunit ribosomal protein L25